MKKLLNKSFYTPLALAVSMSGTALMYSSSAHAEISANVSLATDYYFRGVSQTNNDPAIQGGFDWSHDSGVYAGIWASNVDFGDDTTIETDFYAGYSGEASGLGYDVGLIYYWYDDVSGTGSKPYEIYLGVSYDMFSAGYAYSPKFFSDEESHYVYAGVEYEIPDTVTLAATVGHSSGDWTDEDFMDYKIGVSKDLAGVTLDLSYVGNDLDDDSGINEDKLIFSISKSF